MNIVYYVTADDKADYLHIYLNKTIPFGIYNYKLTGYLCDKFRNLPETDIHTHTHTHTHTDISQWHNKHRSDVTNIYNILTHAQ